MQDPTTLDTILSQTQILDGKKVDCKRAVPRDQSHSQASSVAPYYKTKKMFVGGLPPDVTDESFRTFFESFGEVEDSVVILDKDTGRPRGFGFVTFTSEDTADKVLENYERNSINGKWVECKKATPRSGGTAGNAYNNYGMQYVVYPSFQQPYYYYGGQGNADYPQNYAPSMYPNTAEYGYQNFGNTEDFSQNENPN